MALSRFRQPVIARAPSLFSVRLLSSFSSFTSTARNSSGQNCFADANGSLLRPTSSTLVSGVHDNSLKLKMQIGVRHFSSSEPPSHDVLGMPALSPTMSQGNIAK